MKKKSLIELTLGLAAALIVLVIYLTGGLTTYELKTLDLRFRILPRITPPREDIVIIAIDDDSLQAEVENLGMWPWPREIHARLIDFLKLSEAKIIAFDILFLEPDKYNPINDRELAKSIKEAGNVYLATEFGEELEYRRKEYLKPEKILKKFEYPPVEKNKEKFLSYPRVTLPLRELSSETGGLGQVNILPDDDGVVRRIPLLINHKNRIYGSFTLEIVRNVLGLKREEVEIAPGESIQMGKIEIPIDEEGRMLISYAGEPRSFKYYSYCGIIDSMIDLSQGRKPEISPFIFKDKIVLIGTTAAGTVDLWATPHSPVVPGVEVQANVLNTILNQDFLRLCPKGINISIILILGLGLGLVIPRVRPLPGGLLALGILVLYLLVAGLFFSSARINLEIIRPSLTIVLAYLGIVVYRYMAEEKEKKWIRRVFSRYVTTQVVDEILSEPEKLSLGGERRPVTILFADIQGFTSLAEDMSPEEVVGILNEYFSAMTKIIFEHQGTLDKFIGDCIMAVFGAPLAIPDHTKRALYTALEMKEELRKLQGKWKREGKIPFRVGIGINTGEVVVGNIGSEERMEYTAVGSEVNLASRLESLTREYDAEIIISEAVYQKVKDIIKVKPLGEAKIKGMKRPVRIYELLGLR